MAIDIVFKDASIIIDLLKLKLFPKMLQLPFKFYTTDFIVNEIVDKEQKILLDVFIEMNTITIIESDSEDLDEISDIFNAVRKLSFADSSIIYFSQKMKAVIFTSDGLLRKIALDKKIEVHGILWIFEKLIEYHIITKNIARKKLTELLQINSYLPKEECEKYLKKWK